jgi:hypothetical protein
MSEKGGKIPFAGALDANTTAHLKSAMTNQTTAQRTGTTAHLAQALPEPAAAAPAAPAPAPATPVPTPAPSGAKSK